MEERKGKGKKKGRHPIKQTIRRRDTIQNIHRSKYRKKNQTDQKREKRMGYALPNY